MTAEMVAEYQPTAYEGPQSAPCRECGTTGGFIPSDYIRPSRRRGYCHHCYERHQASGEFAMVDGQVRLYATEAEMLWHTTDMVKQPHALRSYAYDPHSVATAAEQRAARWLLDHPEQVQAGLTEATPLFGWGSGMSETPQSRAWGER